MPVNKSRRRRPRRREGGEKGGGGGSWVLLVFYLLLFSAVISLLGGFAGWWVICGLSGFLPPLLRGEVFHPPPRRRGYPPLKVVRCLSERLQAEHGKVEGEREEKGRRERG